MIFMVFTTRVPEREKFVSGGRFLRVFFQRLKIVIRKMIAYDTATEDHVFQMINELYRGDGSSRDEVNQWLQGSWKFVTSF